MELADPVALSITDETISEAEATAEEALLWAKVDPARVRSGSVEVRVLNFILGD